MSRTSAYRAEPGSVASAQVALRVGTLAWAGAAVIGTLIVRTQNGNIAHWIAMCAIGVVSGILGLVFLKRKARGR
jgi:hypothetical protein